ncbi:MAG: hypothetical protein IJ458_01995 [Clostridia bacterium]|nr:hypothetical protein [Clostridia bacterium]
MIEFDKYGFKKDDISFKRLASKDDIKYRKIVQVTFEKRLKEVLEKDCTLCFHGTPIWNAKEIIKSGNITSLIDRIGPKENVIPNPGKISVSTINNLWFTIKYHADLFNYDYPAGCVFVIQPKDEDEIKSSRENNEINNIYFDKQPERLKAIITTPENINLVRSWIDESNLKINNQIVVDYDEFIINIKNEYQLGKLL